MSHCYSVTGVRDHTDMENSYVHHLGTVAPAELQYALQVEAVTVRKLESCEGSTRHPKPEVRATVII
jgi:hypothetical protein